MHPHILYKMTKLNHLTSVLGRRCKDIIKPYFTEVILQDQDLLMDEKQAEKMLEIIANEGWTDQEN